VSLPRAIERLIRIERIAIQAKVDVVSMQLDLPLRRLVTLLAQALELPVTKAFQSPRCGTT